MEFTLAELFTAFIYSMLLGLVLALLYEPIRIIHLIGFNGKAAYFITDTLFIVICSLITFYFSLAMLEGRIRGFVILGEIIGFFVFRYTLKNIFDCIYLPILKLLKKIIKKVLKIGRKLMYNVKVKCNSIFNKIMSKVSIYEKRRNEKRENRRGKEKRYKRSRAPKKKAQ